MSSETGSVSYPVFNSLLVLCCFFFFCVLVIAAFTCVVSFLLCPSCRVGARYPSLCFSLQRRGHLSPFPWDVACPWCCHVACPKGHFAGQCLLGQQVARTSCVSFELFIQLSSYHVELLLFADKKSEQIIHESMTRLFSLASFLPPLVTVFSHLNE